MTQRALALIDGEHYAPVVRAALEELPYSFVAAAPARRDGEAARRRRLRRPARRDARARARRAPSRGRRRSLGRAVLGPVERFSVASKVLVRGVPYVGADFRFDPPALEPFPRPSIGIVGTGKRVGKTSITAHAASLLARDRRVVVVAMGRGGPPEPEVAEIPPTVDALLELSRAGRHAASDYLETAALAGVPTVGCRRCGGGLAGSVFASNVSAGARKALELDPELVLFDGSGAALPPIATSRADPRRERAAGLGGRHRLPERVPAPDLRPRRADDGRGRQRVGGAARARPGSWLRAVVATVLRPRPVAPIEGRRVAFFSTAPATARSPGCRRTSRRRTAPTSSTSPAASPTGRRCAASSRQVDADLFLVELKAAAIDVVAAAGRERGVEVMLAGSDVLRRAGARSPRSTRSCIRLAAGGGRMSERRHGRVDFLGERTPYSKGLMARVLSAVGVSEERAYELARPHRGRSRRPQRRRGRPRPHARARGRSARRAGGRRARSGGSSASGTCRSSICR